MDSIRFFFSSVGVIVGSERESVHHHQRLLRATTAAGDARWQLRAMATDHVGQDDTEMMISWRWNVPVQDRNRAREYGAEFISLELFWAYLGLYEDWN